MARTPRSSYFGTDKLIQPAAAPAGGALAEMGADELMMAQPGSASLGDGGGADPRLGVEGEPPPYEPGGRPLYEAEESTAALELYDYLSSMGISPEEAGSMTLDDIFYRLGGAGARNQGLLNAHGVVNQGNANVPVEDPSAGPGALPRYIPDEPR